VIPLRYLSALMVTMLPSALYAQGQNASPWALDRSLTVSPQGAPVPALKYRLLPPNWELKEGNAVPIYLRLVHEQSDAARKYWTETPRQWNVLPVDKIPLDDAHKFLQKERNFLVQLDFGARRRTAEWNYTLETDDPIGLLLPDVQWMRNYVPMLILQARTALAEGKFTAAAHHLETGFAFSRHLAEGPTLIHKLVAVAVAWQFAGATADFMERPGAPNLYWALTALPKPLIDLRSGLDFEYRTMEMMFPELDDLDRQRTPGEWDAIFRKVRSRLRVLFPLSWEGKKGPDLPEDLAADVAASESPHFPDARAYVAKRKGFSEEQLRKLSAAQIMVLYIFGTYHEDRDDLFRASYFPYDQAQPLLDAAAKRLKEAPASEGHVLARLLLPAIGKVMLATLRLDRDLAALRVIEGVRMYSADHGGKLPERLANVSEVPMPNDPGTHRPFEYAVDGETATLTSRMPGGTPLNGLRYRVTIRK
jgi:hypothetical protein